MESLALPSMSADEFVAWAMQRQDGCRYELSAGEVVAMGSERVRHAIVKGEIFAALRDAVRKAGLPCQVFPDGMAIKIDNVTVYEPDAALRCGPAVPDDAVTYNDPIVVAEVLSPSAAGLDAGGKLADYFRLPSLQHYLILHPAQKRVIHHQRAGADILTRLLSMGPLLLDPPGLTLDVAALFA